VRVNRVELASRVSERSGLTIKQSGAAIAAMLECISAALEAGEAVSLHGFGTFSAIGRRARSAVHPKTGETLQVPATRAAKFVAATALKRRLAAEAPPTGATGTRPTQG
jgi:nucleoid DNA-binding protein